MAARIYLETDDNENCPYMPMQVFEPKADLVPVHKVRIHEPGRPHAIYQVTGWSSEGSGTPCPALYAPVADSGQAVAYLVCGGDWGVRLKPMNGDNDWDINNSDQWGEAYLVLTDQTDILLDA